MFLQFISLSSSCTVILARDGSSSPFLSLFTPILMTFFSQLTLLSPHPLLFLLRPFSCSCHFLPCPYLLSSLLLFTSLSFPLIMFTLRLFISFPFLSFISLLFHFSLLLFSLLLFTSFYFSVLLLFPPQEWNIQASICQKSSRSSFFLVACYATLHPALSVRWSVGPLSRPSVRHTLLFGQRPQRGDVL